MFHRIERQADGPHSVLGVEGGSLVVSAVSLAQVGRHEENVATELDKILVTASELHLLRTDFSNKRKVYMECIDWTLRETAP